MYWILERENCELITEYCLWKQLLDNSKENYIEVTPREIEQMAISDIPDNCIPLGSIPFTNIILQQKYGISQMNPIEIPKILRTPMFLGRQYDIVSADNIPLQGQYFIKDASEFKRLNYLGDISKLDRKLLIPEHYYVLSEPMNVLSEYRVYIVHNEIYAIEYYNGAPLTLPDVSVIQRAQIIYATENHAPQSYTIDVMVTPKGTFLTEIQPVLFAVGLYTTVLGQSFLQGYKDSLNYVLHYNCPVEI